MPIVEAGLEAEEDEEQLQSPARASITPPAAFDETTDALAGDDLPLQVDADFMPLPEAGADARVDRGDIDPFQYDSLQAQEAFDAAVAVATAGDEERAIQEYLRAAKIAETAREWYLAAIACQRVGDFLLRPRPPSDLERGFRMYRRAIASYEQCGLFAEARELAYRLMCIKLRRAGELKLSLAHRVELFLFWASAGFGYRPLRVLACALVLVLLYGLAYWATAGVVDVRFHQPVSLWHSLYFSGITFATVGYGDFIPADQARLLALTEGALGACFLGFFVAVLANRLSKS
jgi:hypothetical protein